MFPEPPSLSKCTINTHLFEVVRTLLTCIAVPSLGGLILSRHLGDLLSALLQLLHEPQMKVEKEAEISTHSPSPSPGVSIKGTHFMSYLLNVQLYWSVVKIISFCVSKLTNI